MQLAQTNNYLMNLPVIPEIRKIINESLTHDWILRVEHKGVSSAASHQWQEWGESAYAIRDASPVIDKISACHSSYPGHAIRLKAEKLSPRTQFCYCVYVPNASEMDKKQLAQECAASQSRLNQWLSSVSDGIMATRNKAWRIATVFGMLVASLLVIEEAMA